MNEFLAAENLLNQAGLVVRNHEKNLRISGNGFSIIHALDLESDEARFHTRFIGYLLNPKAGHFQGDKFLKLFFEAIGIKEDTDGFTVEIEKHIGKRDWENIEGGRIDFLISNPSKYIGYAVEIKIFAGEQEMQLKRYANYLNKNFNSGESKVYFLTLEGDKSQVHKWFDKYEKISFREHIHKWIENCRLASIDQPVIRETLTQYIANIKRLTNQNPDDQMSDDLINLITSSSESFKAYNALKGLEYKLYQKFGEVLVESLNNQTDLNEDFRIEFNNRKIPNLDAEISFFLGESNDLRVRLYWLENRTIGIGMHVGMLPEERMRVEMKRRLDVMDLGNYRNNTGWVWLSEIREFRGEPQLSYDSWKKFQSQEFALKVAGWVKAIAKAYEEVTSK